jgi:diadenosine tetraphosphate (Ap4A) HIT family hydrolase
MVCVFGDRLGAGNLSVEDDLAVGFPDAFPLTRGHTLVVPRRHEADCFALSPDEQTAMWRLVNDVQQRLARQERPDGYNVGVNVGAAGGQTVGHVPIHLIPRYAGDVGDPRGGIRWILPARARYWEK